MKHKTFLAALLAMAISGTAGAQAESWTTDNGIYKFAGCYGVAAGVNCDLSYTLLKLQNADFQLHYRDVQYFLADGTSGTSEGVSLAGEDFQGYSNAAIISNVPLKIVVNYNLPRTTRSIAALVIEGHRINNVMVSQTGAPAVAAPAKPATPPAVAVPNNGGIPAGFSIRLSACKVAAGIYTCVATLTPSR